MHYRRFGRTELQMPAFSCGTMRFQQSWNDADIDKVTEENQRNLEATVERAFELGIIHVETARGYGTSEAQLGRILPRLDRDRLIAQTKVEPVPDPATFEKNVRDSLGRLQLDHVDLFALHGINNAELVEWSLRPGGCLDVAEKLRKEGLIRHLGFSTHAPTELILELVQTGRFDYVNLHWYYIFQDNWPAIVAARKQDMGIFIISPSDKGGRLYSPPAKLVELCTPYAPLVFNHLFCLSHPEVHTLSIGASRPAEYNDHLEALDLLESSNTELDAVVTRLESEFRRVLGEPYASTWKDGLPSWEDVPGQMNIKFVLWIYNLTRAFDLMDYGKTRYAFLKNNVTHWLPGRPVQHRHLKKLANCLKHSPHAEEIPRLLKEAHELFR